MAKITPSKFLYLEKMTPAKFMYLVYYCVAEIAVGNTFDYLGMPSSTLVDYYNFLHLFEWYFQVFVPSYIEEFMWHERYDKTNGLAYINILRHIA